MLVLLRVVAAALVAATSSAPVDAIDAGHLVRVRVVSRAPIVDGGAIVAVLADPIYVRDRLVVSAGAAVTGRMQTFRAASTRDQVAAMAGGDLTPARGVRVRFDTLTPSADASIRIDASATIDTNEPATRTGEWIKDYLLGQLPYHRRYVHADAIATMTFVEPVALAQLPPARAGAAATVSARLLTRVDSSRAAVGDEVAAQLLVPVHDAHGAIVASEGTVVIGHVTAVARAGAFGRGGRIAIGFDSLTASQATGELPVRFVWPPLALLALVGARDPAAADQSTFLGRAGAGWSGFLVIGAAIAPAAEPVAIGFGAWGLLHSTWVNVLRKGRDVVLPADAIVLLATAPSS